MIRIGLCDDEINVIKGIAKIMESSLINLDLDAEIVVITDNQEQIFSAIKNNEIDVLFLDIDFKSSDKNGIKFAKELRQINKMFKLVFLTGHFEYSLLAFKCKTFDYVLKPITIQNLEPVLMRLKEDIENNSFDFIKVNKNFTIRTNDILFIERNKSKAIIHTASSNYESCLSLNAVLENLPNSFIRIHRSYIINQNQIQTIDKENKIINFEGNKFCPISQFDFKEFN
jgi:DNA-binding LytR/AlgR family response regulator